MRIATFVRLAASAALAALTISCSSGSTAPFTVKLIGFGDFQGNLQSPGTLGANSAVPAAQRPPVGGAEYLAAYVQMLKARNPLNVVVGAGDMVGASPPVSGLFFDEPAVEALNKIGLEFTAIGHHELDQGTAELLRLQNGGCKADPDSCKGVGSRAPGTFDGASFKWLAANMIDNATDQPLLPPYMIKSFNGVEVAFIGLTLKATPTLVTATGIAGLTFADEADTINSLVARLRARGIEAIVVLVHQGGEQASPTLGDINACDGDLKNPDGTDSDVGAIVRRLDDAVDLVISGHTQIPYNCSASTVDAAVVNGTTTSTPRPTGLPNKAGRRVPVTNAGALGQLLTDIDLTIDPLTRDVTKVAATNRLVDRTDAAVAADPAVKNIVDGYLALAAPLMNAPIGTIAAAVPNVANDAGEMPAGNLIADAQLRATQPAAQGGAVMAFMNSGGVRDPGLVATAEGIYPYDVTYGNALTMQPFGNTLVTMTLTAQQIKDLLEQQFPGCMGQTDDRILQVSNGVQYAWSASAPCGSRIVELTFTPVDVGVVPPAAAGVPEHIVSGGALQVPVDKPYRVAVNSFLADGGDEFTLLKGGANVQRGGLRDIDALVAYLGGYKAPAAAYDPALGAHNAPRIRRLP
jgi:5'-nucleotidase